VISAHYLDVLMEHRCPRLCTHFESVLCQCYRKSTIAKLVQRFYDPTDGRVLLDGTDLRDINVRDLRACIGVVSQEPLLFDTTIEDNIRYGKPDATFEEIVKAAESANAHDFIVSFPEGYQTNVGSRGGKFVLFSWRCYWNN